MLQRLFVEHPRSVNETYFEHFGVASRFGIAMIWGGMCALVHALVPGWCVTTGGDIVLNLTRNLIEHRHAKGEDVSQILSLDWVI